MFDATWLAVGLPFLVIDLSGSCPRLAGCCCYRCDPLLGRLPFSLVLRQSLVCPGSGRCLDWHWLRLGAVQIRGSVRIACLKLLCSESLPDYMATIGENVLPCRAGV